ILFGNLLHVARSDPNEAHTQSTRALTVTCEGIADEQRRLRRCSESVERRAKDRRIRFRQADLLAVDDDAEGSRQFGAPAHRIEVAVKIRDDAESITCPERFEQWAIASEGGDRLCKKTLGRATTPIAVGCLVTMNPGGDQRAVEIADQSAH